MSARRACLGKSGIKVIRQMREETGYNIDEVNYCFCDVVHDQFIELRGIVLLEGQP